MTAIKVFPVDAGIIAGSTYHAYAGWQEAPGMQVGK